MAKSINKLEEIPELMSAVDTAWLRMEREKNQMTITGVIYLEPAPDFDKLLDVLKERLLVYDRFKKKIIWMGETPCWVEDKSFDIRNHVFEFDLQSEYKTTELDSFIGDLMSQSMDFGKPLWELYLIPETSRGSAIVAKLHHAIADGIALVSILLSLATIRPDGPFFDPASEYPARDRNHEKGFRSGLQFLFSEAKMVFNSLAKFLTMPSDTATQVKGPLQIRKKAAWSKALPLDKIKKCAADYNATINDLLLWFTCNALREYLLDLDQLNKHANIRIILPVNLRKKTDTDKLGNKFGLIFLTLPIGEEDSVMRLRNIQKQMRNIKNSREALVAYGVLALLGRAPETFKEFVVNFLSSKCSAVITNVPGPRKELFIAGSSMKEIMFWVPKSGKLGLGISLISYNNKVMLGLAADTGRVENPSEIIKIFERQAQEVIKDY